MPKPTPRLVGSISVLSAIILVFTILVIITIYEHINRHPDDIFYTLSPYVFIGPAIIIPTAYVLYSIVEAIRDT